MERCPINFQGFNEYAEVRLYEHGILPHWRQNGCTYFVTYRLADSLPRSVLDRLNQERLAWLNFHGIDGGKPGWKQEFARLLGKEDQRAYEREFGGRYNRQLDLGLGSCVLRQPEVARIVAESLEFFHGQRVHTGNYIVMPNHVHVLLTPVPPFRLEDVLKSIKGFSAREINALLGRTGPLWQRQSYDHIVRDADQLERFQRYIRENPSKANLIPGDYRLFEAEYAFG